MDYTVSTDIFKFIYYTLKQQNYSLDNIIQKSLFIDINH